MDDLVTRLRAKKPVMAYEADGSPAFDPINPDGPEAANRIEALEAENKAMREAGIFDHKWLDPACVDNGCQSLFLKQSTELLKRITFMARTSGGTAGPDSDLMAACDEAETFLSALLPLDKEKVG
jgi:hypothetical protein